MAVAPRGPKDSGAAPLANLLFSTFLWRHFCTFAGPASDDDLPRSPDPGAPAARRTLGVTVGKRVIEPLSLVGEKGKFPLVHAVVDLVAASCVRAAYDKHSHSDLQHQPKACLEKPCRALEATLYKAFSPSSRTCDAASGGRA